MAMHPAELETQQRADEPGSAEPGVPFARHVELRAVVLSDLRILFLPNPKAGCTSILWLLAELDGVPTEAFERSTLPEVSPALTIHDMSLWGPGYRLADYEGAERARILTEGGWFRFSTVRNPASRLWSAWQSKLLAREPRFVAAFGDEPWFPRIPERPEQLVEDFRRFVAALPGGTAEDVHWAVQHDLLKLLPLDHVGKVERVDETLALLRAHMPNVPWPAKAERENRTALPIPPHGYDEETAAVLRERYRADFEQYEYDTPGVEAEPEAVRRWEERVAPLLPLLQDAIEKHRRIGQLNQVARRTQKLEKRIEAMASRQSGRSQSPVFTNLEGHTDFNVRWSWEEARPEPGFTAVVRAKNEAQTLPWTLPPLLRAVRRVVVVDNGSTDGTGDVARRVAAEAGASDCLEVRSYPFAVARCGEEHLSTPAESVHSLAYFYNWSFSLVRTSYALKWDADMVLTDPAVSALRDLAWQLEASELVVKIPRYPLYVADEGRGFLDLGLSNCEPWAWPNRPGYSFVKAMEWEQPLWPAGVRMMVFPDWSCIELKHLDVDEFAHWSPTDFEASARTRRKSREWQVFRALSEGGGLPDKVIAVESPDGMHVIDYVRSTWLREKADERGDLGERLLRQLTA